MNALAQFPQELGVQYLNNLKVLTSPRVQEELFAPQSHWIDILWRPDMCHYPSTNFERGLSAGVLVGHLSENERVPGRCQFQTKPGAWWCGLSLNVDRQHPARLGSECISLEMHLEEVVRMGGMYEVLENLPGELLEMVGQTQICNPFLEGDEEKEAGA